MGTLRLPVRLYVGAVIATGLVALITAPFLPDQRGSLDPVLIAVLLVVATVANVQMVHISVKTKVGVGGAAVFAGVLMVTPPVAMAIGGLSVFIGQRFAMKQQQLYNRLFNTAGTILAAGAAAALVRGLAARKGLLDDPIAIVLGAATYYLVKATITDIVIALQLRRDPVRGWWANHRREVFHHAALYLLGILAAVSAERQPLMLLLFLVPMGLIFLALREATKLRRSTKQAIVELADLIDQRDPYTFGHSQRVAEHAQRVARHLRLSSERVEFITEAARMHDIGKITTPDHILKKPGPLDEREWAEMRKHCEAGHRFLQQLPEFADGANLVLCHHERADGMGYPRGLRGMELPIEASIISVCDAYDAMTSDRVYRPALPAGRVIAELRAGRGTQWHEGAADALLALIAEGVVVPYSQQAAASA